MNIVGMLKDIDKVGERITDDLSRLIWEARLDYALTRETYQFYDKILTALSDFKCQEVEELDRLFGVKKNIILFGVGNDGKYTYKILEKCNYKDRIIGFCDNYSNNEELYGLNIIRPSEINPEDIVIISSRRYADVIYKQLLTMFELPRENILYPRRGYIYAQTGSQYFDVFLPGDKEVFLDGGSSYGNNSLEFIKWCGGNYEKIYAFEPRDTAKCMSTLSNNDNIEIIAKGIWSKEAELSFTINGSASKISDRGDCIIPVTSIDSVLSGRKVTFIKFDIEGSELEGLKGAQSTIIKHKPRLAISIYHKPYDCLEIPLYLLGLHPDYKFTIRHYSSNMSETVLYAE
jgi:FkbM family methyltransferase